VAQTGTIYFNVLFSSALAVATSPASVVLMLLCAIIYGVFGGYALYFSPTIKRQTSLLLATFSLSGCLVSILSLVGEVTGSLNPILCVVFLVVLIVCFHVGLQILNRRWTETSLTIFGTLDASPDLMSSIASEYWKNPRQFVRDVRLVFEHWPPFLFTWKLTSWSLDEWPTSHDVCLLWCRIVSFFPAQDSLFRWLTTQYSKMPPQLLRTAYLNEMIHLSGCRITDTTLRIRMSLESIDRRISHIRALQRRFWKDILERTVVNFW
jgi:hypothetical protein